MPVDEQRAELERALQSVQFRRAPKLQRFLAFICERYFCNKAAEISEYLIATEAFGKAPDFDPSLDSLVRVQAREARRRLREYYQSEGKDNPLILDIPVGSYAPLFTAAGERPRAAHAPLLKPSWGTVAAFSVLSALVLLAADAGRRRWMPGSITAAAPPVASALSSPVAGLWKRFIDSEVPTVLVLSNPAVAACTNPLGCPDEYTGMGEAVALHLITGVFKGAKQRLIVKQSRMLNADDLKHYNLILLGGKVVNPWTRKLGQDLNLTPTEDPPPPPFETRVDSKTGKLVRDRGIVALRLHGPTKRWQLFLYGRHSQGTQAAAEAATDERLLAQLKWPAAVTPFPDNFQVLLSVAVTDGVPEEVSPVAVRVP